MAEDIVADPVSDSKSPLNWFQTAGDWAKRDPIAALLLITIAATLVYFFGYVKIFTNGSLSTWIWAWQAWNPETNYEHAKIIPLITVFLVWYARDKLKVAPIGSSRWGWLFIGVGLFFFVAGARTLQARLALTALPFLLFGVVLCVWGRHVARILLFPIAFLLFMVPLNFLTQATTKLQFIETGAASAICNFFGLAVYTVGTSVNAANEAFHFQIDEGCSGIRSLMAIAMLSAVYGHLSQNRLWKKLAIFAAALLFAIIGNTGRLVSIMLIARLFGQDLAGGPYHVISGYLSFPFAIAAMLLFGKLLNINARSGKGATADEGIGFV
ncbi:MAG TPA: exosortase/archaeosortase family protein [Chthoniobacterales bacterium]|jgi:exosortase|nr:exosortase/archaeosortase family protein [Chthoniobacterales bacterium]